MRIDIPICHFENCMFHKCNNCMSKTEFERCAYQEAVSDVVKLTGVMWFVDKWLDESEKEGKDEVQRADFMREKTLRIIEGLEKELRELKEQNER